MAITKIRFAFAQVETFTAPLAALTPPAIPYSFLLNELTYQAQLASTQAGTTAYGLPWASHFGKKFWFYYLEKKDADDAVTPNAMSRGLVPLVTNVTHGATLPSAPASVTVRTFLYPWAIGAIADVNVSGSWPLLTDAVPLGLAVKAELAASSLLKNAIATLRAQAYGATAKAGAPGDLLSVVTVLDAAGIDSTTPVVEGSAFHRALQGLADWNNLWETVTLRKLSDHTIELKQSPPGHIAFRARSGRVLWLPGQFPASNKAASKRALRCYHQNLSMSMLQAESLCLLLRATSEQLAASGGGLGQFSVAYQNFVRRAAGIVGRLCGGTKTYRSASLRNQIKPAYLNDVDTVRSALGLSPLQ